MRLTTYNWGALTSKPHSFNFRSWEAVPRTALDWFDPLGSNIKLELRGIQINRVIPGVNKSINGEWISDKIRFSYDGLKRQRLDRSYLLNIEINWKTVFSFVEKSLKICNDVYKYSSKFMGLSVAMLLKTVFGSLSSDELETDFQSNFLLKGTMDKSLLFLDVNPRLDSPIFHLRVKSKSQKGIFQWGSENFWNFYYKHIGNQISSLFCFLEGKHKLVKKNPLVFCTKKYFSMIKKDKVIWSEDVGSLSMKENHLVENMEKGFPLNLKKSEMVLWFDNDESKSDLFSIYYGHHGDKNVQNSQLILSGTVPTERSETFLNLFGFYQKMERILSISNKIKEEKSFVSFYLFLVMKKIKEELWLWEDLRLKLGWIFHIKRENLKKGLKKKMTYKNNLTLKDLIDYLKKEKEYFRISRIWESIEGNNNIDFFLNNSLSRASISMGLMSAAMKRENYK
jgi:NADH dehydrogenase/NADH:ubiquinone oxidoreductase subunit G